MEQVLSKMREQIARLTEGGEEYNSAINDLTLYQRRAPSEPVSGMYEPSVCVVVQGAKQVYLGEESYRYDPSNYLITSVHLPTMVQIVDASPDKPYLGFKLKLDLKDIASMLVAESLPLIKANQGNRAMATGRLTPELGDAFVRLLNLLDSEADIPILAPLIQKEILYRLLMGEQGAHLRQIASVGSQSQQIARSIEWLKSHFSEALQIKELADRAGMSSSTFHHHFRAVTALSPLQYQKQLRLREARQLMLNEQCDAANAAYRVGYESPSQFSREYSRLFGAPPQRDIAQLRLSVGG